MAVAFKSVDLEFVSTYPENLANLIPILLADVAEQILTKTGSQIHVPSINQSQPFLHLFSQPHFLVSADFEPPVATENQDYIVNMVTAAANATGLVLAEGKIQVRYDYVLTNY